MKKFFYCPICNKQYDTRRELNTHFGETHKEYYEIYKKKLLEDKQKNYTIQCPYCEQKFKSIRSLIKHAVKIHKIYQRIKIDYKYNGKHPVCKCGCGEMVGYNNRKSDFNEYIKGHNRKSKQ